MGFSLVWPDTFFGFDLSFLDHARADAKNNVSSSSPVRAFSNPLRLVLLLAIPTNSRQNRKSVDRVFLVSRSCSLRVVSLIIQLVAQCFLKPLTVCRADLKSEVKLKELINFKQQQILRKLHQRHLPELRGRNVSPSETESRSDVS